MVSENQQNGDFSPHSTPINPPNPDGNTGDSSEDFDTVPMPRVRGERGCIIIEGDDGIDPWVIDVRRCEVRVGGEVVPIPRGGDPMDVINALMQADLRHTLKEHPPRPRTKRRKPRGFGGES